VTAQPTVSVFVPSLNTKSATELCLRSARALAGHPFTLHVGDCGSTDGTLTMLRNFESEGRLSLEIAPDGRYHAAWLDHWLGSCTDDYAVFVDSDVEFRRPGWLRDLVETARGAGAALVAAEMLPDVPRFPAPKAGLKPEDRAEMLAQFFDGQEELTLVGRPAPWLLLIDTKQVVPLGASFAYRLERGTQPDDLAAFDVGGWLFRQVEDAGLRWRVMPRAFQRSYHHYGGLSWVPLKGRRGLKKRRDLVEVHLRLLRARRRDKDGRP
jgi:glycosyltransferase involved in cell wall biosynthesis